MKYCPRPISKHCTERILKQMNSSIYKIKEKDGKYSTCFFTFIKNTNNEIPVIIINNSENYNNRINIYNNNVNKKIELTEKKFQSKKFNISIIEIKEMKNDDEIQFLEIDENIYRKDYELYYPKESIYIIQDNNINKYSEDYFISYGIIDNLNNGRIKYLSKTKSNSKGSPIFNLSNNKIIGIQEFNSNKNGIFLNELITKFIKINFRKKRNLVKNNKINIKLKINEEDINKKIYFLDNYEENGHFHTHLKELNELNTEVYINNNKSKYEKYIIAKEKGIYDIKLKINTKLTDCSYMFFNCKNIIKIDFISFNTNDVVNMNYMFCKCNINDINLLSFDIRNVISMRAMFAFCKFLNNINLSSFNPHNTTSMFAMFYGCSSLNLLTYMTKVNSYNNIDMSLMFGECSSLKSLPELTNIFRQGKQKQMLFQKREEELLQFLLCDTIMNDIYIEHRDIISNSFPFFSFKLKDRIYNYVLISNDIILVPKNQLDKKEDDDSKKFLYFPIIEEYINKNDLIIETFLDSFSIVKIKNEKFYFKKFFKIPNDIFINSSDEKFIINKERKEELIKEIEDKASENYIPGSPIYFKKHNELFILGLVNYKKEFIFLIMMN